MTSTKIEFYRGLRSTYLTNTNSNINNAIFFASDTKELFVGKKSYSGLTDVTFENNIFTFKGYNINPTNKYGSDVNSITLNLNDKLLSTQQKNVLDNINTILSESVKYSSKIDDTVTTTSAVGAINKGTKAKDLKGKSFTELMDMIFFPTIYPEKVEPFINLSVSSPQLVGTKISKVSVSSSFNQGYYKLNGQNTGIKVVGTGVLASTTWKPSTTNIVEGTNTVTVEYAYGEGEQPKDNKGNNHGTPVPGGKLTKSVSTIGVYQYKYGVGDPDQLIPLTTATSFEFKVPAEKTDELGVMAEKHCFAIPAKYTVTKIELLNTLSNQWVAQDLSLFGDKSGFGISLGDIGVDYTKYKRSDAALNGEAKYRITFTK